MTALLRYPGAKWSMAKEIIKYFPEHKGYLEPYFGSGGVLFNKGKSSLETINDIDGEVVNFFRILKAEGKKLQTSLCLVPYSRQLYEQMVNYQPTENYDRAIRFFIISWMSHSGYQPNKTGWSHSKNPNGPNKATIFKNVVDSLEQFADRLREVQIENTNALELIKAHDFKDTLIYLDPPYLLETRKQHLYKHEMSNKEHKELLETIVNMKAKILLSGYENNLYNSILKNWNKEVFKSLDGKGNIKQEVIWFNYDVQLTLF